MFIVQWNIYKLIRKSHKFDISVLNKNLQDKNPFDARINSIAHDKFTREQTNETREIILNYKISFNEKYSRILCV